MTFWKVKRVTREGPIIGQNSILKPGHLSKMQTKVKALLDGKESRDRRGCHREIIIRDIFHEVPSCPRDPRHSG